MHNHPLAYIDPDGQLAFLLVPLALSLAADFILPTAVAAIQPYTGAIVGSFLTGLVNSYNCSYTLDSIDPACQLSACLGMGVGTILNLNPKGACKTTTKVATKLATQIAEKEAIAITKNLVSRKVTQNARWFTPSNAMLQTSQRTAHAAEKYFEKNGTDCVTDLFHR